MKWLVSFDDEGDMWLVRGDMTDDEAIRLVVEEANPCDDPGDFRVHARGWWRTVPCRHASDDEHTIHYEPTRAQTRGGFLAVDVRRAGDPR